MKTEIKIEQPLVYNAEHLKEHSPFSESLKNIGLVKRNSIVAAKNYF